MKHSDSYDDVVGGPAGENLYWASWEAEPNLAVSSWYDEINFCGDMPGCKFDKTGVVGHFTAMIWAGATQFACTRSQAEPGLIACRYGNGPGS